MKLLNSIYIKITSWVLILSFVFVYMLNDYGYCQQYVDALKAVKFIDKLDIPIEFGNVIERYNPPTGKDNIILIQDLHANYGVQENIRNILEFIRKEHGISRIG
ncbi:hypothetical protein ACFLTD_05095, partial [Elusimicrobiota bacterium]